MVFGTKIKFLKLPVTELLIRTNANTTLTPVTSFKYLGLWFDSHLTFGMHIDTLTSKTYAKLGVLYRNKSSRSLLVRKRISQQMLMPIIDDGDIVYGSASQTHLSKLDTLYNSICRFVLQCNYNTHHCEMLKELDWSSLESSTEGGTEDLLIPGFPRVAPQAPFLPTAANTHVLHNLSPMHNMPPSAHLEYKEQSLLQPPTLQLLNGMGPLGRRASDGGANIQLHAQQLLKRPRGPSPLVTMTTVSSRSL
ncbi:hypothetical protein FKM82_021531 [Ascaphus truei]